MVCIDFPAVGAFRRNKDESRHARNMNRIRKKVEAAASRQVPDIVD